MRGRDHGHRQPQPAQLQRVQDLRGRKAKPRGRGDRLRGHPQARGDGGQDHRRQQTGATRSATSGSRTPSTCGASWTCPRASPWKVVIDASNGMAGTMIPRSAGRLRSWRRQVRDHRAQLREHQGCLSRARAQPAGRGEHEDGPGRRSSTRAHVGFCYGDADRCMAVDEKGRIDRLRPADLAAGGGTFSQAPREHRLRPRSSKAVEEDIRKAGGTPSGAAWATSS